MHHSSLRCSVGNQKWNILRELTTVNLQARQASTEQWTSWGKGYPVINFVSPCDFATFFMFQGFCYVYSHMNLQQCPALISVVKQHLVHIKDIPADCIAEQQHPCPMPETTPAPTIHSAGSKAVATVKTLLCTNADPPVVVLPVGVYSSNLPVQHWVQLIKRLNPGANNLTLALTHPSSEVQCIELQL
eukprot:TRINITY_DN67788_c1_g5_i1.p1 TRINITY_DN67788_c1_g5~~TRINITY_DN67788_c1_g5_i1.p1  ORF type:complete len:188 (+),score=19.10 TRINITY_DN67788_c1_g5_i1:266-829(+)